MADVRSGSRVAYPCSSLSPQEHQIAQRRPRLHQHASQQRASLPGGVELRSRSSQSSIGVAATGRFATGMSRSFDGASISEASVASFLRCEWRESDETQIRRSCGRRVFFLVCRASSGRVFRLFSTCIFGQVFFLRVSNEAISSFR